MRLKKKYAKGGEIDSLLSYLQSKNKPTGLVKPQESYAQPAVAESTRTQQAFLPDLENERFKQVLADRYLQSRQGEVAAPPTPETNKMYSGQAETALGATLMTPIGDVADIASGIKSFAEAEGFAQKALAAGETGVAMALMLAPINLTQIKSIARDFRGQGGTKVADYLDEISESGTDIMRDADLAEEMGLDADDIEAVTDALRGMERTNFSYDSSQITDLTEELDRRLYGDEMEDFADDIFGSTTISKPEPPKSTFDPNSIKDKIGSFTATRKDADGVTWRDNEGNRVVLSVDKETNPVTKKVEEVYSIDAFGFQSENSGSPSRVFTEALLAVPVGSSFYSSSMSADSYPLFLKFLSGRKGRAPKARVNEDFPITYSSLNSLGGKAQAGRLSSGGLDSYFGLTKDQIDRLAFSESKRSDLEPVKEAIDKKLAEAGLPESRIEEYTSSLSGSTYYQITVPYPVIKRVEEGFKYGGIMRPLKRQKNSLSIKKRNV